MYRYFGPRNDFWATQYSPTKDMYWCWDVSRKQGSWVDGYGNEIISSTYTLSRFLRDWHLPECVPLFVVPEHLQVSEGL